MPWCSMIVTWAPAGYQQNYQPSLAVHSHQLPQDSVMDYLPDSLNRVNAYLPRAQTPAAQDEVGQQKLVVQQTNDPRPDCGLI